MFAQHPIKLLDCQFHPPGVAAELMIVEGDSASTAVGITRDSSYQAVLPIQGKPLNAWKATRTKVASNEFYSAITQAIGAGWDDTFCLEKARYQHVVLIFDPDADGIHCSMLVLMFFYRWMRPLLDSGRILLVRPPMFEINATHFTETLCAETDEQAVAHVERLRLDGYQDITKKRFRGLASMGNAILSKYCVNPASRHVFSMRAEDAVAAIRAFSPNFKVEKS
jgi:DNA gyrase subunit B